MSRDESPLGRMRRALALRSRTSDEKPADVIWPLGEIKELDANSECAGDHQWSTDTVCGPDLILRGCQGCSAIQRIPPAPDPRDRAAVEEWLGA